MHGNLPFCFTKQDILFQSKVPLETVNSQIRRALRRHDFFQLKNGLYIKADIYTYEFDKQKLHEYVASRLIPGSYISLEYVLEMHQIIPLRSVSTLTSVTTKCTRTFENFAGSFSYSNIKPSCFFGFEDMKFHEYTYHVATKAKALFDYFYLNSDLDYRNQKRLQRQLFGDLSIQWQNFSEEDFVQFDAYVWKSNSFKMMKIRRLIEEYFEKKKFDRWAKALLS